MTKRNIYITSRRSISQIMTSMNFSRIIEALAIAAIIIALGQAIDNPPEAIEKQKSANVTLPTA